MARSHLRYIVQDNNGNVIQNAAVSFTLSGVMHNAETGGSAVTSPLLSNNQGEVEAWLDTPQRVTITVTDNSDAAYYPATPLVTISFATFIEVIDIWPAAGDIVLVGAIPLSSLPDSVKEEVERFVHTGSLAVGFIGNAPLQIKYSCDIVNVSLSARVAPTAQALVVDVNKNDAGTVYTTQENRPQLAIGSKLGTATTPDVVSLVTNDALYVDLDTPDTGGVADTLQVAVLLRRTA